jgi:predicted RNA-binding Zn ribbon-like protein
MTFVPVTAMSLVQWLTMQPLDELPFIGGDPALDFVNTAEERGHPEAGDVLRTPADLRRWGQRYGLLGRSATLGGDAGRELEKAREARELLYRLFLDRAHDRPAPAAALTGLAQLAADAYRAATLDLDAAGGVGWRWRRSALESVRHVAVASAVDLLRADPSPRLKQCPGDRCGWFFLDTSKRGNRRWCSMGECGQDAKNLRRRTSPASGPPVTGRPGA